MIIILEMSHIKFLLIFIFLLIPFTTSGSSQETSISDDMLKNPVRYIEVHEWAFYVAARVAILHSVVLENKSDVAYTDIKVRVNYYSTTPGSYGMKVGFQEKVLNITLPPRSKKKYLREGMPIGAGSPQLLAKNLEIRSAKVAR